MPSECCAFTKTMKRFGTITMLCQIVVTAITISCTFSREITVHARGQGSQRLVQIKGSNKKS